MSIKRLAGCITCHAWNADGSKVALCPNDNTIRIYAKRGNDFALEHTLSEHDQVVTSIDWAPKSNRIVSCSQDRNAYVWTFASNQWKPVLVILRINRAATHVKWSPEENKFAVASGAKCVSVCYFEEDNDWWVSKHIKKHKSTVLQVDWHPNNVLLATASSDFRCRIFAAFIKGVDKQVAQTPFGSKLPFGELFCELDSCSGWVQACRWSPSGNQLAFVGHDSTLCVANVSSGQPSVSVVYLKDLPFRDILFPSDNVIVAVGHDNAPIMFANQGGWKLARKLDSGGGAKGPVAQSSASSAREAFRGKVDKGEATTETKLDTKHQNCVTCIQAIGRSGQFSTTGLDGQIAIWDAPK